MKALIEINERQARVNGIFISAEWRSKRFDWRLAAIHEALELIDGIVDWCWYKPLPEVSEFQAKLELVDIYAFLSSWAMSESGSTPYTSLKMHYFSSITSAPVDESEFFTLLVNAKLPIDAIKAFFKLLKHFDITVDELNRLHAAKSTLNLFRKANGYKEGKYIKMWYGVEDNYYLEKWFNFNQSKPSEEIEPDLTKYLQKQYAEITK